MPAVCVVLAGTVNCSPHSEQLPEIITCHARGTSLPAATGGRWVRVRWTGTSSRRAEERRGGRRPGTTRDSRRQHTRFSRDWSSDVCSSDLCLGTLRNNAECPPYVSC